MTLEEQAILGISAFNRIEDENAKERYNSNPYRNRVYEVEDYEGFKILFPDEDKPVKVQPKCNDDLPF